MKTIFLLAFLTILISPILQAQTIYVDGSNTSGIEDGTAAHPFNTVREGIATASPGNTVFIREGTYVPDENWSGDSHCLYLKAGVKLLGEGAGKTIVDGNIIDQAVSNLSISVEKISFKEFHFGRVTIAGPFPEQNVIKDCKATLIAIKHGAGIPVNDSTPGPIYGFTIENNQMGIEGGIEFKQGAGNAVIKVLNNTCGAISISSGGGFTYLIDQNDIQLGIADKSGACTTTISNNRIADGPIIDRSGGRQDGVEDEIIENNTITCSDQSQMLADEFDLAGIIAKSRSVTIRNNTITAKGQVSGINTSAGAPMNLTNNVIVIDEVLQIPPDVDNATWGIRNYSGYGMVTGNSIHGGYVGYYSKAATVDFSNNIIKKSFIGFLSSGAEEVHHNTIEDCHGDGMILNRLKGPIHHNTIRNNAGSGIRVIYPGIDLGGGKDGSPGLNIIRGNGNFDLYIENWPAPTVTLYARNNIWDHTDPDEILHFDMYDARGPGGRPDVDFLPLGVLGIWDPELYDGLSIYPNPANDCDIHVESDNGLEWVQLMNLAGEVLKSYRLNGEKHCGVELLGQNPGYYIISVREITGQTSHQKVACFRNN